MRLHRANERRGVILLVVLALLTLFAIVGITFVLYSDSEAAAARIAREAETQQRADVDPEQALAFFLGQLLYDVSDSDVTGLGSGLRGHSLARTMYGFNSAAPISNVVPFNGNGRLHYTNTQAAGADDYTLVNYTYFSGDNFLRDPERYGVRSSPAAAQTNSYVAGNAPYTYPDLNNFFLAAVNAYGQVLTPSYHRAWLFQNVAGKLYAFNDMTNPNWINAQGKYLTPRPRPFEHPQFPIPDDAFGDVKNLLWTEGPNDSIWIDLGAPVMTAPDGTQYKMMFAPLIVDLDGRINLNTAGNILGAGNTHVSNQGWGPWEVNLAKVLYADQAVNMATTPPTYSTPPTEYMNLIIGRNLGASAILGRYGAQLTIAPNPPAFMPTSINPTTTAPIYSSTVLPIGPTSNPTLPSPIQGTLPHFYAPVDFNAMTDPAPGSFSPPLQPPGFGGPATNCFPTFAPTAYLNGGMENINHPLLYNVFRSPQVLDGDRRVFRAADMEALLRPNNNFNQPLNQRTTDSGSQALLTDLMRLCPTNLGPLNNNPRLRNLITTVSTDLAVPGASPYWYSLGGVNPAPYTASAATPFPGAPSSGALTFPPVPPLPPVPPPPPPPLPPVSNNPGAMPPNYSDFGSDWRALSTALNRIKMNRPLPPFPHMGSGMVPPYGAAIVAFGTSYDLTKPNIANQYNAALSARQSLADDIYNRLLSLTGVTPFAVPAMPTAAELATRRWLAQLAVNIVDFIDEDDFSTPYNFAAPGGSTAIGATQGGDDPNATGANPTFWVFGTELPKVVLNEALAEAQNSTPALAKLTAGDTVNIWVELFNTMQAPTAGTQGQDGNPVPLYFTGNGGYSPYRVTIAQNLMSNPAPLPDASANVLGKASVGGPFPVSTNNADFAPANVKTIGGGAAPGGSTVATQQYFLVGPTPPTPAANYQDPFQAPETPAATSVVRTTNMSYTPTWVVGGADERTNGLTVLLRRLAIPYLPFNANPSIPNPMSPGNFLPNPAYNPYVTIDYLEKVPIRSNGVPLAGGAAKPVQPFASRGKLQPYTALTQVAGAGPTATTQATSPTADQPPPAQQSGVRHTFGQQNNPLPQSKHYDWLVHLDRPVISPIELLHVSGYQPYQLTQQFMTGSNTVATSMFQHYVPWLDAPQLPATINTVSTPWWYDATLAAGGSHRLYRLFEFLECGDRAFGVDGQGRIPGKVNINTYWDAEIPQALIDGNPSIGLPPPVPSNRPPYATDPVVQIFNNLMQSRSPNAAYDVTSGICKGAVPIGPVNMGTVSDDRPFLPLSTGSFASLPGVPPPPALPQFPNGVSVQNTILRAMGTQLLLQNPADSNTVHPYLQTQLLSKLYNNVTTRSNTFAVFVTVGFFQVIPGGAVNQPSVPQLGPEIGRSEGRQVRHRMFAIVDRTNLTTLTTSSGTPIPAPSTGTTTSVQVTLPPQVLPQPPQAVVLDRRTGFSWPIQTGMQLVIEPGTANEETVTVTAVSTTPPSPPPNPPLYQIQFTANFAKQHPNPAVTGTPGGGYTIIQRGNPGPLPAYDPRNDPYVVPYFSLID